MNQKRIEPSVAFLALSILILVSVVGCAGVPKESGQIELTATEFDLGTIPNTEPVSRVFQVRNMGRGPLAISSVSTSCGCTTAKVGNRSLSPGEATDLTVSYDPMAHDGATGEFMRIVYVHSNDPDTPEASLTIRVTVVEP